MSKFNLFICAAASVVMATSCGTSSHLTQIAAHRGFWKCEEASFAENSIKSLQLAQENNLWGSEFDVHLTSDNIAVVHHDNHIKKNKINDNTYEFFKQFPLKNGEIMPTLDEYLAQGEKSKTTVLVCELKSQKDKATEMAMTDQTIELLKAHNLFNPKRVMFISFSIEICKKIAAECPKFTNQYLGDDISPDQLAAMGINGIDFEQHVFDKHPDWYTQARNHKMSVNCWTVNKEDDIKKMINLGVDCITTNEPLLVRQLLGKKEKKN